MPDPPIQDLSEVDGQVGSEQASSPLLEMRHSLPNGQQNSSHRDLKNLMRLIGALL